MLVLRRKIGESVTLSDSSGLSVEFKILRSKGNSVTVGVEAPKSLSVKRSELADIPMKNFIVPFVRAAEGSSNA